MKFKAAGILLLLAAGLLAGCHDKQATTNAGNQTAVLGGFGSSEPGNAAGVPPPPGVPKGAAPQVVRASPDVALAVWVQDGHVVAANYTQATGWSAPQPLEQIYGIASDPQLASDGKGTAMAVWRHTVGSIEALRSSKYDTSGWSVPDVMPGALPRPRNEHDAAPQLRMEPNGQAYAEWASGFDPHEIQTSHYVPGEGWSHATNQAVAAAAPASSPAVR